MRGARKRTNYLSAETKEAREKKTAPLKEGGAVLNESTGFRLEEDGQSGHGKKLT